MKTVRTCYGDFDFSAMELKGNSELSREQHILYFIFWLIMVLMSSIVFLNFIIAEVGNSYRTIRNSIDVHITKHKASLIEFAEVFYE